MAATETTTIKVEKPQNANAHNRFPTMMLSTDNAAKIKASSNMHSFKLLMLGHGRTGKTSIVRRFIQNTFLPTYKMTFGAAQWQFKCQVPVDLMEEIPKDQNLLHSMTSFFNMDQTVLNELQEDLNQMGMSEDRDPFEDDDKNAESVADLYPSYIPVSRGSSIASRGSAIGNYGSFTVPHIKEDNDIRKTSVNLNIDLDIIDVGFHPTEDELYDDVNAIILVVDYSNKDSITESINKYEAFLNHLKYEKLEYIPIIVAANKCDVEKRQFRKKDVKKTIKKILIPIIDEHFPEESVDEQSNHKKKPRNYTNTTLLQTPNLSFVYDKADEASDAEQSDNEQKSDVEENEDGLQQAQQSLNESKAKPKKKRLKKDDLRYINVISCSAKSGKNIEKLFESCIKKTLPSKLQSSVTHSRQQTTAHVTAPIWLRNLVTDFDRSASNLDHPYFQSDQFVDDNFDFIEDDK